MESWEADGTCLTRPTGYGPGLPDDTPGTRWWAGSDKVRRGWFARPRGPAPPLGCAGRDPREGDAVRCPAHTPVRSEDPCCGFSHSTAPHPGHWALVNIETRDVGRDLKTVDLQQAQPCWCHVASPINGDRRYAPMKPSDTLHHQENQHGQEDRQHEEGLAAPSAPPPSPLR